MPRLAARAALLIALPAALSSPPALAADRPPTAQEIQFFETKVRPVLAERCFKCHGEATQIVGLRLDSRAAMLRGGEGRRPVIVPGQPDNSLLVKAVRHEDEKLKMPPTKKLSSQQIADLTLWVKAGAPWPADEARPKGGPHWSFQPLNRPPVPAVHDRGWAANPVDAFVLARLEAKGLRPSPPASKVELIRRATFDLT